MSMELYKAFDRYYGIQTWTAIEKLERESIHAKESLCKILSGNKHYAGNGRVVMPFMPEFDMDGVEQFLRFLGHVNAPSFLLEIVSNTERYITEGDVGVLQENGILGVREGQKRTRVVMILCKRCGISDITGFNSAYARYADVYQKERQLKLVISCNINDIIRMSNGKGWETNLSIKPFACGVKNMSGVPISYALDESTLIAYTTEDKGGNDDVILSSMILHYADGILIGDSLFPSVNDKRLKSFVMCVAEQTLRQGKWSKGDYDDVRNESNIVPNMSGTPSVSYADKAKRKRVVVGGEPICIVCGRKHRIIESVMCDRCIAKYDMYEGEWRMWN